MSYQDEYSWPARLRRWGEMSSNITRIAATMIAGYFVVTIILDLNERALKYNRAVEIGLIRASDPRLAPPPPQPRAESSKK